MLWKPREKASVNKEGAAAAAGTAKAVVGKVWTHVIRSQ